jgi:hypothetical protein
MQNYKNKLLFFAGIVIIGLLLVTSITNIALHNNQSVQTRTEPSITVVPTTSGISYSGSDGVDALTLLKAKTAVQQDASGMVTMINGRTASQKNHEFWAFYVNGKLASVGSADYQTRKGDRIEWKLETY